MLSENKPRTQAHIFQEVDARDAHSVHVFLQFRLDLSDECRRWQASRPQKNLNLLVLVGRDRVRVRTCVEFGSHRT